MHYCDKGSLYWEKLIGFVRRDAEERGSKSRREGGRVGEGRKSRREEWMLSHGSRELFSNPTSQ